MANTTNKTSCKKYWADYDFAVQCKLISVPYYMNNIFIGFMFKIFTMEYIEFKNTKLLNIASILSKYCLL